MQKEEKKRQTTIKKTKLSENRTGKGKTKRDKKTSDD